MKITVEFESIEEFEAFRTSGKTTRGRKGKDEPEAETEASKPEAPAPLQPPAQGFNPGAAPSAGPNPFAPAAPPAGQRTVDPAIQALVDRIATRTNALAVGGTDQSHMLKWYRDECTKAGAGADATNATMDQILTVLLPRMSQPALENIVKLVGA